MKLEPSTLVLVALVGGGLFLAGRCGRSEPTPPFSTDRLDSNRVVTESVRVVQRVRDTLWRVRVEHVLDSIPVLIAQVDSAACAPVILGLTRCAEELDSARVVADGWHLLAVRESTQATMERVRADSILDALKKKKLPRFGCLAGVSAGYDPFSKAGFTGLGVTCGLRL